MNCRNEFIALCRDRYAWVRKTHGPGAKDRTRTSITQLLVEKFPGANSPLSIGIVTLSAGYFSAAMSISKTGIPLWMVSKEDIVYLGMMTIFLVGPTILSLLTIFSLYTRQSGGIFRFCPTPQKLLSCISKIIFFHFSAIFFAAILNIFPITSPVVLDYYVSTIYLFFLMLASEIALWTLGAILFLPKRRRRRFAWGWGWRRSNKSRIIKMLKMPDHLGTIFIAVFSLLLLCTGVISQKFDALLKSDIVSGRTGVKNKAASIEVQGTLVHCTIVYFSSEWLVATSLDKKNTHYIPMSSINRITLDSYLGDENKFSSIKK